MVYPRLAIRFDFPKQKQYMSDISHIVSDASSTDSESSGDDHEGLDVVMQSIGLDPSEAWTMSV